MEFESPWPCQPGKVRVIHPEECVSREAISNKAWRNGLTQPYIFETLFERRMHFTNEATQSAMLLADPNALIAQYMRKMMAFLLFNPQPEHIVMLGLGGGSLPKFCYRHLPRSRITVVEINEDVIALRNEFCIPKDDARLRVVHADAGTFMDRFDDKVDAIYTTLLSRKPTPAEKEKWIKAQEKGLTDYEDLIYSLINTQQFIFIQ